MQLILDRHRRRVGHWQLHLANEGLSFSLTESFTEVAGIAHI